MNRKTLLVAAGGLTVAAAAFALAWLTRTPSEELKAVPACNDPDCCGGLYGDHTDGIQPASDPIFSPCQPCCGGTPPQHKFSCGNARSLADGE